MVKKLIIFLLLIFTVIIICSCSSNKEEVKEKEVIKTIYLEEKPNHIGEVIEVDRENQKIKIKNYKTGKVEELKFSDYLNIKSVEVKDMYDFGQFTDYKNYYVIAYTTQDIFGQEAKDPEKIVLIKIGKDIWWEVK